MFHAKDGWFFERLTDGSVNISQQRPAGEDLHGVILDADTWCSAVASVAAQGETAETFQKALELHTGS